MRSVLDSVARAQAAATRERTAVSEAPGSAALGRADSMRIARQRADSVRALRPNSLSQEAYAARAANLGPARRVFVSIPKELRGSTTINAAGAVTMNALRAALARDPRYIVIPADTVAQTLARTRATDSIATLLGVELMASMVPIVAGEGSLVWQLTTRDLGAVSAYSSRLTSMTVPLDSLLARTDSLVAQAVRRFAEMDRAPRKAPPPS
ncbi:MAG: hypothetical protein ACHQU1_13350 [Gemmatimonadales bacterium]